MSIKDRDYWEDAPGGWDREGEPSAKPKRPWTAGRILAWVSIGLIVASIVAVAVLNGSK